MVIKLTLKKWLLFAIRWIILFSPDYLKDLVVIHDSKLKFDYHVNELVNKSYAVLDLIYRNFRYMSSGTFVMLYKTLVRSHLEYANCVWSQSRKTHIEKLENVQMTATRMVQHLKKYSYEARLRCLYLPKLKYTRLQRDMIQVYNIVQEV